MPKPSTKKMGRRGTGRTTCHSRDGTLALHQDLDRFFYLLIFAFADALSVVSQFEVRFDLCLFHELTFLIAKTNFRNAKNQPRVLQSLPPDRCSSPRDRHANQFSDPEMLVNPGKQVRIGVIALTDQDDALSVPSFIRFPSDTLSAWKELKIRNATQERCQSVMKIPASIEPRINDQGLLLAFAAQGFGVGLPITLVVHP